MLVVPYPQKWQLAYAFVTNHSDTIKDKLSDEMKLLLYSLNQQSVVGPCNTPCPKLWNVIEKAKWDCWKRLGKMDKLEAMRLYVRTVEDMEPKWLDTPNILEYLKHPEQLPDANPPTAEDSKAEPSPAKKTTEPVTSEDDSYDKIVQLPNEPGWHTVQAKGAVPSPRYKHAAVVIESRLYIFGGHGGRFYNDLHTFRLDTCSWTRATIPKEARPAARAGHSATVLARSIVVLGGHGRLASALDNAYMLDTVSMKWETKQTSGAIPTPRGGHVAFAAGRKLYIFGGENPTGHHFNDMACLDTDTWTWSEVKCSGQLPSARSDTTLTVMADRVYLFGGSESGVCRNDLYVLHLAELRWEQLKCNGPQPSARAGHAATPIHNCIVYVGGGNGQCGLSDMHMLDTVNHEWISPTQTSPSNFGVAALGRESLSLNVLDNKLVIFGGYDGRFINEIMVCHPEMLLPSSAHRSSSTAPLRTDSSNSASLREQLELEKKARIEMERKVEDLPDKYALLQQENQRLKDELDKQTRALQRQRQSWSGWIGGFFGWSAAPALPSTPKEASV